MGAELDLERLGAPRAAGLGMNATETEVQIARKEVQEAREAKDQILLGQAAALCSSTGRGEEVDSLLRLGFGHLERAPGSNLSALLDQYRSTSRDLSLARDEAQTVQRMADWWSNHALCKARRERGEYAEAVRALADLEVTWGDGLENFGDRETFEEEHGLLRTALTEEVRGHVRALLEFETNPSGGSVAAASDKGDGASPRDLWSACENLGILPEELERAKASVSASVVAPALAGLAGLRVSVEVPGESGGGGLRWEAGGPAGDDPLLLPQIRSYAALACFLWDNVFGACDVCAAAAVEAVWLPVVAAARATWDAAITAESFREAGEYAGLLEALRSLEADLAGRGLLRPGDGCPLSGHLCERLDSLCEGAKRGYLAEARGLIAGRYGRGDGGVVLVGSWEDSAAVAAGLLGGSQPEPVGLPAARGGALLVSSVAAEVASLLERAMEDAGSCANPVLAPKLVEAVSDVSLLWAHLPALLLRKELCSAAHHVASYFNDTTHVVWTVARLACRQHGLARRCGKAAELAAQAGRLSGAALSHMEGQVAGRAEELELLLRGGGIFRGTHKANRDARAREALSDAKGKLTRLAGTWKSVLQPEHFARFFGAVLEAACVSVYDEVTSADDISVAETEALPGILLVLVGDGLGPFLDRRSPGQPEGPRSGDFLAPLLLERAPSFRKLAELVPMFTMGLQEIEEEWRAGGFGGALTADEVCHFIAKVFEESPLRREKVGAILGRG